MLCLKAIPSNSKACFNGTGKQDLLFGTETCRSLSSKPAYFQYWLCWIFTLRFLVLLNVNLGGEFCLCFSRNADIHLDASETDKRNKEEWWPSGCWVSFCERFMRRQQRWPSGQCQEQLFHTIDLNSTLCNLLSLNNFLTDSIFPFPSLGMGGNRDILGMLCLGGSAIYLWLMCYLLAQVRRDKVFVAQALAALECVSSPQVWLSALKSS